MCSQGVGGYTRRQSKQANKSGKNIVSKKSQKSENNWNMNRVERIKKEMIEKWTYTKFFHGNLVTIRNK